MFSVMSKTIVLKDGVEVERAIEKIIVREQTLFGGCPEKFTIAVPQLEPEETVVFRGRVALIKSKRVPG
jgi:hypothetical protein